MTNITDGKKCIKKYIFILYMILVNVVILTN